MLKTFLQLVNSWWTILVWSGDWMLHHGIVVWVPTLRSHVCHSTSCWPGICCRKCVGLHLRGSSTRDLSLNYTRYDFMDIWMHVLKLNKNQLLLNLVLTVVLQIYFIPFFFSVLNKKKTLSWLASSSSCVTWIRPFLDNVAIRVIR